MLSIAVREARIRCASCEAPPRPPTLEAIACGRLYCSECRAQSPSSCGDDSCLCALVCAPHFDRVLRQVPRQGPAAPPGGPSIPQREASAVEEAPAVPARAASLPDGADPGEAGGYAPERFGRPDLARLLGLLCPVCLCVARDAAVLPCGHVFCYGCVHRHLWRGRPSCPSCNAAAAVGDARRSPAVQACVGAMEAGCAHGGCGVRGTLSEVLAHEALPCRFRPTAAARAAEARPASRPAAAGRPEYAERVRVLREAREALRRERYPEARRLLERAESGGFLTVFGMEALGDMHFRGLGTRADVARAVAYFEAAQLDYGAAGAGGTVDGVARRPFAGEPVTMAMHARRCYEAGRYETALRVLAVLRGRGVMTPDAWFVLGNLHFHGHGSAPRDPLAAASDMYERAAAAGHAEAAFWAACVWDDGLGGVPRDAARADRLFRRAAAAGLLTAHLYRAQSALRDGDFGKAMPMLLLLEAHEHPEGLKLLGDAYERGWCGEDAEGERWRAGALHARAADLGWMPHSHPPGRGAFLPAGERCHLLGSRCAQSPAAAASILGAGYGQRGVRRTAAQVLLLARLTDKGTYASRLHATKLYGSVAEGCEAAGATRQQRGEAHWRGGVLLKLLQDYAGSRAQLAKARRLGYVAPSPAARRPASQAARRPRTEPARCCAVM